MVVVRIFFGVGYILLKVCMFIHLLCSLCDDVGMFISPSWCFMLS